jgi:hypothetical protein
MATLFALAFSAFQCKTLYRGMLHISWITCMSLVWDLIGLVLGYKVTYRCICKIIHIRAFWPRIIDNQSSHFNTLPYQLLSFSLYIRKPECEHAKDSGGSPGEDEVKVQWGTLRHAAYWSQKRSRWKATCKKLDRKCKIEPSPDISPPRYRATVT